MFGLGLPELIVILVIVGIPVGIILLIRSSNKKRRSQVVMGLPEAAPPDKYVFQKDPASLTKFLRVMLWIYFGVIIISLLFDFMQLSLLGSQSFSQAEAAANDLRQSIIGGFHIAAFVVTGIGFLKWIYRANTNSRGFGARNMQYTPGWSVGYYFIPFLNLYRPYQAMKEVWKISKDPADWQNQPSSPLLVWWWALWIISGVLGQISFRMSIAADAVSSLKAATVMSIVSHIAVIPLCMVGVSLVSAIFLQQKSLTERESCHGASAGK
jgi:hypothetical protein